MKASKKANAPRRHDGIHECLTCDWRPRDGKRLSCGLCPSCRQQAYRAIRAGTVTREDLERKGLMLPGRRGKRAGAWTLKAAALLHKAG